MKNPKFTLGQLIHHKRYGYRGVIFDVDDRCLVDDDEPTENTVDNTSEHAIEFSPTGHAPAVLPTVLNEISRKIPEHLEQPWYHILVDDTESITYVAQENLEEDFYKSPIEHPLVYEYFDAYANGSYLREFDA